jgi:F-type H+-transporting ATPase subunit epsilon
MDGSCHLLATTWEWKEDIDKERAERAKEKAEAILKTEGLSDKDFALATAKLNRALVRLSVKE